MRRLRTVALMSASLQRPFVSCALLLTALVVCSARGAETAPSSARFVPAKDLAVYVEYDGVESHGEAWRASAAYAILNKTSAGAMSADIVRQVIDRLLTGPQQSLLDGADFLALVRGQRNRWELAAA